MPIPTPEKNESKDEFISRCISTLSRADPNKPHEQVIAICEDTYRRHKDMGQKDPVEEIFNRNKAQKKND